MPVVRISRKDLAERGPGGRRPAEAGECETFQEAALDPIAALEIVVEQEHTAAAA